MDQIMDESGHSDSDRRFIGSTIVRTTRKDG